MASKRQQPHHYYSVFIDRPGSDEMVYFGFSERIASWQFYTAIKRAARTPGATSVDLRQDGQPVASVPIKVEVPA